MKTTILLIIVVLFLGGCKEPRPNAVYQFKAKVAYLDGSIDTITFSQRSIGGYSVETKIYLDKKVDSPVPCLVVYSGVLYKNVACFVKWYEIIEKKRI